MHLMNTQDNDHVSVHQLRGFLGTNLVEAFNEAYALSRGTKCTRYLFSLSLSPPSSASVDVRAFERAIDAIEEKIGLVGQPRAIVFHEKEGRRHAHCVWSRIDVESMTALNLSHYKLKLRDMSRSLYLEHGWKMPRGLANSSERDPLNFTLTEWQQLKRMKRDPRLVKAAFQDAWATSDSPAAFAQALAVRGFYLARGDRRSFVAVDLKGDIFAIARWTGIKTKVVNARLGDADQYDSVEAMTAQLTAKLTRRLAAMFDEANTRHSTTATLLEDKRRRLVISQRHERNRLARLHAERRSTEQAERISRFPTGLKGFWSRITGGHAKIKAINAEDARSADLRDLKETQAFIDDQMLQRQSLQSEIARARANEATELRRLHRGFAGSMLSASPVHDPSRTIEPEHNRRRPTR